MDLGDDQCLMYNLKYDLGFASETEIGDGSCLEKMIVVMVIRNGQIQDIFYNNFYFVSLSFGFENCSANFPY